MSAIILVIIILLCVAVILLGAHVGKPLGWLAIGFGVLALLLALLDFAKIFR